LATSPPKIEMDDLLKAFSDYLLDSGFQDPYSRFSELNGDHTLENLREAISPGARIRGLAR